MYGDVGLYIYIHAHIRLRKVDTLYPVPTHARHPCPHAYAYTHTRTYSHTHHARTHVARIGAHMHARNNGTSIPLGGKGERPIHATRYSPRGTNKRHNHPPTRLSTREHLA